MTISLWIVSNPSAIRDLSLKRWDRVVNIKLNIEPTAQDDQPSLVQKQGMRAVLLTQSVGVIASLVFQYGAILLYLRSMGVPSTRAMVYASFPFAALLLNIPAAYLADRYGKKRVAVPGLIAATVGFALLMAAGSLPDSIREAVAVTGIVIFAITQVCSSASWYALLKPIVPDSMRGRFFGRLRLLWTMVAIVFMTVSALVTSQDTPPAIFQCLLLIIEGGLILKIFFYMRIPEMEPTPPASLNLRGALSALLRTPGYAPFCAYVFLLSLFSAAGPSIFVLMEKEALGLGDNIVLWLGNLVILGTLIGFYLGGKAVDRFGTKTIFVLCHFAYGLILSLFLVRGLFPSHTVLLAAIINLLFGVNYAASSIAITSETFSLMPRENCSLSGALAQTVYFSGGALSSMLAVGLIKLGLLREHWTLGSLPLTVYDSVLLFYAALVVLLVVTLGQIPSVVQKHQWIPGMR